MRCSIGAAEATGAASALTTVATARPRRSVLWVFMSSPSLGSSSAIRSRSSLRHVGKRSADGGKQLVNGTPGGGTLDGRESADALMDFRILGSLQVVAGERLIPLGGAQQRQV